MKTAFALVLCALVGLSLGSDPYVVFKDPGNFTIKTVTMSTPTGHWTAGEIATVKLTGKVMKTLLAGTVKYQIYESYVPSFVGQGNFAYFKCTIKGCDTSEPVALTLQVPSAVPTDYELEFQFQMVGAQKSGDFRIVVWGQDQDHFPYDFSVTIGYNYTSAAADESELVGDKYDLTTDPGNFTVATAQMTTPTGHWAAGQIATLQFTGITKKIILAGTVKYQIYEAYVPSFVAQGNAAYFVCNNKGCDTSKPVALTLIEPGKIDSGYRLKFQFQMVEAQKTGQFRIVVYGQDQDHFPYDFSATIGYNYTQAV